MDSRGEGAGLLKQLTWVGIYIFLLTSFLKEAVVLNLYQWCKKKSATHSCVIFFDIDSFLYWRVILLIILIDPIF
jgi:hypothetical protein